MEEREKGIKDDIEQQGDVTHTVFTPPQPAKSPRISKPLPAWLRRTLIIVAILVLAGASFYGGWRLMGRNDTKPVSSNNVAEQEWQIAKAKAKVPRTGVSAALFNGKVFVVGGQNEAGADQSTVELFDPQSGAWSDGPALPVALHHAAAAVFDDGLYVVGGLNGDASVSNKVFIYDGDAWLEGPALPEPLGAHGAAVVGDRLYVVGGLNGNGTSTGVMYSLGKDDSEWRKEADMSTARYKLAVAAANDRLYAIGGRDASSSSLKTVEVYDPGSKRWTTGADMLIGRSDIASAVLDNRIYVFGGESADTVFTDAEAYNPATQTWRTLPPMSQARHGMGSTTYEGDIFLFLGGPNPGVSVSGDVQILKFE